VAFTQASRPASAQGFRLNRMRSHVQEPFAGNCRNRGESGAFQSKLLVGRFARLSALNTTLECDAIEQSLWLDRAQADGYVGRRPSGR